MEGKGLPTPSLSRGCIEGSATLANPTHRPPVLRWLDLALAQRSSAHPRVQSATLDLRLPARMKFDGKRSLAEVSAKPTGFFAHQ